MTTTDPIDRDFGAPDDRSWPTVADLHDEITRQTIDALEHATAEEAPALLAVLLDVARLRGLQTPEPTTTEGV